MANSKNPVYIAAGDLRHQIQIQRPINTQNNLGEIVDDPSSVGYETIIRPRAAIEPITGDEFWAAGRYEHEVDTLIRIRYRPGLDNTMQAIWTDAAGQLHTYHIHGVIDIEQRHIQLHLICKEVA